MLPVADALVMRFLSELTEIPGTGTEVLKKRRRCRVRFESLTGITELGYGMGG